MSEKIGIVTIEYFENGVVRRAEFAPTLKLSVSSALADQLTNQQPNTAEEAKNNADLVFASWFSKMNEIELADRTLYEVKGNMLECETYADGHPKKCVFEYTFGFINNSN